jgi:hypothetical protein
MRYVSRRRTSDSVINGLARGSGIKLSSSELRPYPVDPPPFFKNPKENKPAPNRRAFRTSKIKRLVKLRLRT